MKYDGCVFSLFMHLLPALGKCQKVFKFGAITILCQRSQIISINQRSAFVRVVHYSHTTFNNIFFTSNYKLPELREALFCATQESKFSAITINFKRKSFAII